MPFIILSCGAPMSRVECEDRIRDLLEPYGQVGGILIAARTDQDPWIAAVEMRSGHDEAVKALRRTQVDGYAVRVRRASALDVQKLTQ